MEHCGIDRGSVQRPRMPWSLACFARIHHDWGLDGPRAPMNGNEHSIKIQMQKLRTSYECPCPAVAAHPGGPPDKNLPPNPTKKTNQPESISCLDKVTIVMPYKAKRFASLTLWPKSNATFYDSSDTTRRLLHHSMTRDSPGPTRNYSTIIHLVLWH